LANYLLHLAYFHLWAASSARPISTDVASSMICVSVCVCVGVLGTRVSCAKMAELIEIPFGGLIHVCRMSHVLDWVQMSRSLRERAPLRGRCAGP